MLVPSHRTPRNLDALADREIDRVVRDDDIAPLAKSRDHTGDGREGLGVHDASPGTQELGNIGLGLHVHVLRAIEAGGSARAHAVGAQCLDGFLLEGLVGDEVVEIVRGEVGNGAAVGEFGFRASGAEEGLERAVFPG